MSNVKSGRNVGNGRGVDGHTAPRKNVVRVPHFCKDFVLDGLQKAAPRGHAYVGRTNLVVQEAPAAGKVAPSAHPHKIKRDPLRHKALKFSSLECRKERPRAARVRHSFLKRAHKALQKGGVGVDSAKTHSTQDALFSITASRSGSGKRFSSFIKTPCTSSGLRKGSFFASKDTFGQLLHRW